MAWSRRTWPSAAGSCHTPSLLFSIIANWRSEAIVPGKLACSSSWQGLTKSTHCRMAHGLRRSLHVARTVPDAVQESVGGS